MELAIAAIETKGTEALSLRALAREAGVSATAPYRHFPSKRCLFAGLATRGFLQLKKAMTQTLVQYASIEERFIAMGLTYIDFAVNNPVPYKLMFGSVLADFSDYAMLQQASEDVYEQLLDELNKLISERALDISPVELGGIVWSGVHGMASLMIDKHTIEFTESQTPSLPVQSIGALHQDTERALRVLFGNLIGASVSRR